MGRSIKLKRLGFVLAVTTVFAHWAQAAPEECGVGFEIPPAMVTVTREYLSWQPQWLKSAAKRLIDDSHLYNPKRAEMWGALIVQYQSGRRHAARFTSHSSDSVRTEDVTQAVLNSKIDAALGSAETSRYIERIYILLTKVHPGKGFTLTDPIITQEEIDEFIDLREKFQARAKRTGISIQGLVLSRPYRCTDCDEALVINVEDSSFTEESELESASHEADRIRARLPALIQELVDIARTKSQGQKPANSDDPKRPLS